MEGRLFHPPRISAYIGNFQVIKFLGSGNYSRVKLVEDLDTKQRFAAKIIKHSHPHFNMKQFSNEVEALMKLDNLHICKIIRSYENLQYRKKNGNTYTAAVIILEFLSGGQLFDYVAQSGRFTEAIARTFFHLLLETIEYCHQKEIYHRDLKLENLMFDENFNLKITDFGASALLCDVTNPQDLRTIVGTDTYMAPELHLKQPYKGNEVDLFALGVILFMLVTKSPPFSKAHPDGDAYYKMFAKNRVDDFWKAHEKFLSRENVTISPEFKELLSKMLAVKPQDRLSITEIKASAWYNGPEANMMELKNQFLERRKIVEERLQQAKEDQIRQKMLKKALAQAPVKNPIAFSGIKPLLRSLGEGEDEFACIQNLLSKVNFDSERSLEKYTPETVSNSSLQIFTEYSADIVLKILYLILKSSNKIKSMIVSETSSKIKCFWTDDNGSGDFSIILSETEDQTISIEFLKLNGNILLFYSLVKELTEEYNKLILSGAGQLLERKN